VLMLTGLDDDASISRAYEAGATDFFVKSSQWRLLAERLRYLLRASHDRIELERSKAKLARAQDLARLGSFDWKRGDGLRLSGEALRVLGYGPDERPSARTLLELVMPEKRGSLTRDLRKALRNASAISHDIPIGLGGADRLATIHLEAEPEFDDRGRATAYSGFVQDVTDRRRAEEAIRRLANFDSLTELPNRHQLVLRAGNALEMAQRGSHQMALLLIDLDRFKIVNDTLGHGAGDDLLVEAARRLKSCVRHVEQVPEGPLEAAGPRGHRALECVGRLGGDEFVALLPEITSDADAEVVAERMLEVLRKPFDVLGQECFVTASVGVAIYPRDGSSVYELLRNADVAMYSVKQKDKNAKAVYHPDLGGQGRLKLELESALHKAIERGELVLHYQPEVGLDPRRLVAVEALMRWQRGAQLVSPGEFIPLAEETGLIVPMSEWALAEAARQARLWHQEFGFDGRISVNMPSRMFLRPDLPDLIERCIRESGAPYGSIQIEITETGLMKDLQAVMPTLHRLSNINVDVSIDDFGTGYSSLAYLSKMPISELKIDRSFVREGGRVAAEHHAAAQGALDRGCAARGTARHAVGASAGSHVGGRAIRQRCRRRACGHFDTARLDPRRRQPRNHRARRPAG
jgi:EAL domain-containing protein (putative c-di-GMP-specific phosphodiesterase class I)/GGDEF domain-containing protein